MTVYTVIIKNSTITNREVIRVSYAYIQLTLFDLTGYSSNKNKYDDAAPASVIVVAIIVGILISSFCIGVIVYLTIRVIKNRGKKEKRDASEEEVLNMDDMKLK
jgi:hypothetical protein